MTARLAETWVRRPASPTRAVIDVTRRCNLRCSMCHTWKRTEHAELSVAQWAAVFKCMPRLCWLDLTGGEPLLRSDFGELVSAALRGLPALGMLHFQTNGWATDRAEAVVRRARTERADVDLIITVSIDGPQAVHDKIRGRPQAHARAVATLQRLHAMAQQDDGLQVHVGTTVTAANAQTYESVGDELERLVPGFSRSHWHWNLGQRSEHFFGNDDVAGVEPGLSRAQLQAAIARHIHQRGIPRGMVGLMESVYLVNLRAVAGGAPSNIPCQSLRSTVFVSPEGDVFPCHIWNRPLGNVLSQPFSTIWASAVVAEARRDVERLACGGCFSACEAYPALAGAPLTTAVTTLRRGLPLARSAG